MWGMFFVNFVVPMVLLMSRDAKRNPRLLIGVGADRLHRSLARPLPDGAARCLGHRPPHSVYWESVCS